MINLQRRKQGALPRKIPSGRHNAGERENTMEENKMPLGQQEEEAEADLLVLADEDGKEYTCEIIAELEHDGGQYVALIPYDEEDVEDDGELNILRVYEEDGERYYDVIDDEEEYIQVSEKLSQLLSEEFDIQL